MDKRRRHEQEKMSVIVPINHHLETYDEVKLSLINSNTNIIDCSRVPIKPTVDSALNIAMLYL